MKWENLKHNGTELVGCVRTTSDAHFGVLHDIQLVQLLYYEHQIWDRRTWRRVTFPTQNTKIPPGIGHARTGALVIRTFWQWSNHDPLEDRSTVSCVRKGFFLRKQLLKPAVKCACTNPWKHTRTVIPNAQISLGRVAGYSSDIMTSGASQFNVPPWGVSTDMLNKEEVKCEYPKSVRSARPSGEISTFIC